MQPFTCKETLRQFWSNIVSYYYIILKQVNNVCFGNNQRVLMTTAYILL